MSRLRSTTLVPTGQVHRQSIEILQERLPFKFKGASCQVVEIGINPERSRNVRTSQYHATSILANFEKNTKLLQEGRFLGGTGLPIRCGHEARS
ncbi:hypothetical protein D4R54_02100 [archaeon]|nr:MAG: hypothetical protein D4R54_02100 [archaeon]